jgi:excisionase family DNA binding protein
MAKHKRDRVYPLSAQLTGDVMNVSGVAAYLCCHPSTVYRLLARHDFPAFRVGSDWRFHRSNIDKWIAAREVSPETEKMLAPGRRRKLKA